jgi:hypothetical protein
MLDLSKDFVIVIRDACWQGLVLFLRLRGRRSMHTQNGNLLKVYLVRICAYMKWFGIVLTSVLELFFADSTVSLPGIDVMIAGIDQMRTIK